MLGLLGNDFGTLGDSQCVIGFHPLAHAENSGTSAELDPIAAPVKHGHHNLPTHATALVGRDQELADLRQLLLGGDGRLVRDAVGPQVEILVEAHRRPAPNEVMRMAQLLEVFEPFWYEEPIDAEDIEGLAEVRRRITLPVVTGEALYSKNQFAQVFAHRAADILNPDVCNCGGS
jgi:Enolase C-terminal domain-like